MIQHGHRGNRKNDPMAMIAAASDNLALSKFNGSGGTPLKSFLIRIFIRICDERHEVPESLSEFEDNCGSGG
eukprot:763050-Hanusia_phi.AAC.4